MKIQTKILKKLTVFAASVVFVASAFALDLSEAKSEGLVGETSSGYLAAVKASSQVNALVADINSKRKAHYQSIAAKNGISLSDVETLAGEKAIAKTPSGQYIKVGGQWKRK